MLAPVAVFAYRRPDHLRSVLEALEAGLLADKTDVTIFVDGPKNETEEANVSATVEVAKSSWCFRSLTVVTSPTNQGLARSILSGVSSMFESNEKLIVLEDDCLPSGKFLTFMNQALEAYEEASDVISISGYAYFDAPRWSQTYFINFIETWGWGSWARVWKSFDPSPADLLEQIESRRLAKRFDFNGAMPFTKLLRQQVNGEVDSWGVSWAAHAVVNGLLTLYPNRSLIEMIGLDNSGTHIGDGHPSKYMGRKANQTFANLRKIPVRESMLARARLIRFFRS